MNLPRNLVPVLHQDLKGKSTLCVIRSTLFVVGALARLTAREALTVAAAPSAPPEPEPDITKRLADEAAAPDPGLARELPEEVGTAKAARILGVSKDTLLRYRAEGVLPARNLAPPGSSRPVYMFPLKAVMEMRTTYQTEQPAPSGPKEPPRRPVLGGRKYRHVIIDDEG